MYDSSHEPLNLSGIHISGKQNLPTQSYFLRKTNNQRKKLPPFINLLEDTDSQSTRVPILLKTTEIDEKTLVELSELEGDKAALELFSENVASLQNYRKELSYLDSATEAVTHPLSLVNSAIVFESLGDAGMFFDTQGKSISLNLDVIAKLNRFALQQKSMTFAEWLSIALTIFLLHEVSHHSQGLTDHADVQAMKGFHLQNANFHIAQMDLRSDYLAAHTLSCLKTLLSNQSIYNDSLYYENFYQIWCIVCKDMLRLFARKPEKRKLKLQRMFGYMLMNVLTTEIYTCNSPLRFKDELFPMWPESKDKIFILSNGKPFIKGQPIESRMMKKALNTLTRGDYDEASMYIKKIWQSLEK